MLYAINQSKCLVLVAVVLPALLIVNSQLALGQIRTMIGTVTDESGNPIVGASVEITRTDVKRNYKTKTDKKGNYVYIGIPFGVYRIVIRKEGFDADYIDGLRPSLGEEDRNDFVLKPGDQQKLAFEYSKEELAKIRKNQAQQKQVNAQSAAVGEMFNQGLGLATQGKYDEAIPILQRALEKDPGQPDIWANLGDIQSKAGKMEDAVASFEKAIALRPDDVGFYQNMGVLFAKMGKEDDAQAAFGKAAELNPEGSAVNFFNLGATLVNSGKLVEAIDAFKRAVEADPDYAEAYYELGICYVGRGQVQETLDVLQKYIEIGSDADHLITAKALVEQLSSGG